MNAWRLFQLSLRIYTLLAALSLASDAGATLPAYDPAGFVGIRKITIYPMMSGEPELQSGASVTRELIVEKAAEVFEQYLSITRANQPITVEKHPRDPRTYMTDDTELRVIVFVRFQTFPEPMPSDTARGVKREPPLVSMTAVPWRTKWPQGTNLPTMNTRVGAIHWTQDRAKLEKQLESQLQFILIPIASGVVAQNKAKP